MNNINHAADAFESIKASSYHHGNLRAALILMARDALKMTLPEKIHLKALAQQLGVSQPAPYRHFSGREALMTAVASDGFDRLLTLLADARDDGPDDLALERLCLAYIAFGLGNLGVYRLMFTRTVLDTSVASKVGSADASFEVLTAEVVQRVGRGRSAAVATTIWATLHGAVGLHADGLLSGPQQGSVTANDVAMEIVAAFAS